MNTLQEVTRDIQEYSDYYIESQIQKYTNRKYNICIKMEHGIYTQEQADKNYERASKICNLFTNEYRRRMLERDKAFTEIIKSMQGQSLGVLTR